MQWICISHWLFLSMSKREHNLTLTGAAGPTTLYCTHTHTYTELKLYSPNTSRMANTTGTATSTGAPHYKRHFDEDRRTSHPSTKPKLLDAIFPRFVTPFRIISQSLRNERALSVLRIRHRGARNSRQIGQQSFFAYSKCTHKKTQ